MTSVKIFNLRSLVDHIRPLVLKVKDQACHESKIALPNTLVGLPEDLQLCILKLLPVKAFLRLCSASVFFETLYKQHSILWRYYLKRDFKVPCPDWRAPREQYKLLFKKRHYKCALSQTISCPNTVIPRRGRAESSAQTTVGVPMRSISEVEVASGSVSSGGGGGSVSSGSTPLFLPVQVDDNEGSHVTSSDVNNNESRGGADNHQESENPEPTT